ncbi:acyltransferase [Paenibacillus lautus]|uniref:acyltransferase family protein n=1 Tax=Paenibacillus lautus TaxID=1401 RepID=UPI003D2DBB27
MNKKSVFYLPQLDGLRFIAFLMILLVHAPVFYFTTTSTELFNFNKMINDKLQVSLNFGVDLFFCLSAFLITTLLIVEFEKKGTFSVGNFLLRRLLRLAPLYYLYVLFVFFVLPFLVNNPDVSPMVVSEQFSQNIKQWLLPSMLFSSNNLGFSTHFIGHLWSISLEMQIYLTLPFILYYFLSKEVLDQKKKALGLVKLLFLLLLFTNSLKIIYILWGFNHPVIYLKTLTRLDPFIIGSLIAIKYKYFPEIKIPFQLLSAAILLCLNFVLPSPFAEPNLFIPIVYLVNALGFGLVLDYLVTRPQSFLSKFFSLRPMSYLGNLTYGLYIFHVLSLYITSKLFEHFELPIVDWFWLLFIVMSFVITLLFSVVSYHFYENKFLRLKHRFSSVTKTEHTVLKRAI